MNHEEIQAKLKNLKADELLDAYKYYKNNFNPLDYDMCDTYDLIKDEIKYRLNMFDVIFKVGESK